MRNVGQVGSCGSFCQGGAGLVERFALATWGGSCSTTWFELYYVPGRRGECAKPIDTV